MASSDSHLLMFMSSHIKLGDLRNEWDIEKIMEHDFWGYIIKTALLSLRSPVLTKATSTLAWGHSNSPWKVPLNEELRPSVNSQDQLASDESESAKTTQLSCSQVPNHKNYEIVNIFNSFNTLNIGIIYYAAKDN